MNDRVVLLSVPGLREQDLAHMPQLRALVAGGDLSSLVPSFPCVTCPVQANMTTGSMPREHGVVANGFFWRGEQRVEMWTAWNDCILRPQIWDRLHEHSPDRKSAVWFPLHSKGCGADLICTPAPIHNPDGSESLWCYTKPTAMYGQLRDALGHFPLQHFWGPLANIKSSAWIVDSAVIAATEQKPDFFYIYLPHLDYAAQKAGPDSEPAQQALGELDAVIGRLIGGFRQAYADSQPLWIVASEYAIAPVNRVTFPNRILREAGLLAVREQEGGEPLDVGQARRFTPRHTVRYGPIERHELLDIPASRAFALADHQLAHVFVQNPADIGRVADLFRGQPGIAEVLAGEDRARYELDHERSGEVVLVSEPDSWQAYYWWLDDSKAPTFARTVDIHRKPGYDPVEMFFDPATRSIPLNASLVKGSHGAPAVGENQRGVIVSSERGVLTGGTLADTDVYEIVLRQFGV